MHLFRIFGFSDFRCVSHFAHFYCFYFISLHNPLFPSPLSSYPLKQFKKRTEVATESTFRKQLQISGVSYVKVCRSTYRCRANIVERVTTNRLVASLNFLWVRFDFPFGSRSIRLKSGSRGDSHFNLFM